MEHPHISAGECNRSRRTCLQILGSGLLLGALAPARALTVSRERREIRPFSAIALDGIGELTIAQGSAEALVVEAEPVLLPRISAVVEQGILRFDYGRGNLITRQPVRFLLTVRRLELLESHGSGDCHLDRLLADRLITVIEGSGDISINQLATRDFVARLSGAGSMEVSGRTERQEVTIDGAGDYQALALHSRMANVSISGAGSMALRVQEQLVADISGSGRISYRGEPEVSQRISGAGLIMRAGSHDD